jgi:3-deoxy-D-manno-octulosonic-acid transferase
MALPVLQRIRAELPDTQIVYTFFSPSAERFAQEVGADFTDYLPFDSAQSTAQILAALRPTTLIFSKLDVWPMLTEQARALGVTLGLISASMPAQSRRHGIGMWLTDDAYRALDLVGAASTEDATRLITAGVRADRVRVTGDTRYDQAQARTRSPRHQTLLSTLRQARPTLVAGSTWPADEAHLLPAWEEVIRQLRGERISPRLIIAPHEIDDAHIRNLEMWATRAGLRHSRVDGAHAANADVVLVDRIGVLADLYALATVAYVGGGFHTAGLHSVVEPAVFHVPTIVGPHHTASRDAVLMRDAGGLAAAKDTASCAALLSALFTDPTQHMQMARAMERVISAELGAVDRSLQIVRELLGRV